MLPTSDPPQDKRPTQTESEGLETNFPSKRTGKKKKKTRGTNTLIRQNRLQKKGHKKRPGRSLHNTQGRIPSRRQKRFNIYAPNIGAPKYIKKILEDFKKDIDSNTIIIGDFHSLLSKKDRSSKQSINKDIVSLNNTLDEMDLTDIYRELLIPNKQKTHSFQVAWNIFKDRPHDRTQSKPQQIQENQNHITHFL